MKKVLFIAAIALCTISCCCNKGENKECQKEAEQTEQVANENAQAEPAQEEAPAAQGEE